jgi:hypothetical protein
MESVANNDMNRIPSPGLIPRLNEDVLRRIAPFLDFQSLRKFRLVSREWNAACLPILMKRSYYNLTHPNCYFGNDYRDLYPGAKHYSSWKISHSAYKSTKILQHNEMWQNLNTLTIHQQLPLSREFNSWCWETIATRCPNLQELTFIFETTYDSKLDSEIELDYEQANVGMPNVSFPKISNLPNLTSVRFEGIYDKRTAYFAQNLLQACINLRHLYFCPIGKSGKGDEDVFGIFKYLRQNPTLTKNLQTFAFNIGVYDSDVADEELLNFVMNLKKEREFFEFLKQNTSSVLPLQFSENLTMLFWDAPFHLDGHLLPGVLTPSIASSLVQLCLNTTVENLEGRADKSRYPIKMSFPNFPRLLALKVGPDACESISVPELVDSAPNLQVLEMKAPRGALDPTEDNMNMFWVTSEGKSYSNPKHSQLRTFCTDIPFFGLHTVHKVSSKFPNLAELRLGRVFKVGLDTFLSSVSSNHSKLERLSWTFEGKFMLDVLFNHLSLVPKLLPTLSSYALGNKNYIGWPASIQDLEESTRELLNIPSYSDKYSCLVINLLIEDLTCDHWIPKENSVRNDDCKKQCYLRRFIQRHNLPIQVHLDKEVREMEQKYKRDHHFKNIWIYK